MESALPLALTAEDLERFVKTFSRDDTFTLLYLLTKAEAPRTLEDLCRRYGASPSEMKDRLDRLNGLGLISRRGRGYLASAKAVVAMQSLEERLGKGRLPAAAITAAAVAPTYVGNELYSAPPVTSNETSFCVRLSIAAVRGVEGEAPPAPETEPVNEGNLTSVAGLTKQSSATRSQLYM